VPSPKKSRYLQILLLANTAWLTITTFNARIICAQDFSYYDNFDDGDVSARTEKGFSVYACQGSSSTGTLNDAGDFVIVAQPWTLWCPRKYDGDRISLSDEWSVRMLVTVDEPPSGYGVGTLSYEHVAILGGRIMSVGHNAGSPDARLEPMPFPADGETLYFQLDSFDGIVTGSIWREGDAESLVQYSKPYELVSTIPGFGLQGGTATFHDLWIASRPISIFPMPGDFDGNGLLNTADIEMLADNLEMNNRFYDLTGDGLVDLDDHTAWIKDVRVSWYGDANLDDEFNSGDLIQVFAAGEYEDAFPGNSTWAEGDWNADGDFTSDDLVAAFADGGFEQGPRQAVAAVPEPSGWSLVAIVMLWLSPALRRRN